MKIPRIRLTENEFNNVQLKRLYDKKLYKVMLFSDPHGWFADLATLSCIYQILLREKFDEVCINGDVADFPYISRHVKKLYEDGILRGYSEVEEINYTREKIIAPLSLVKAKKRLRIGNHDERVTKPNLLGDGQLAKLAVLYKAFETTEYDKMLGIHSKEDWIYDPSDVYTYFEMFDVTHGLSLAKNAAEQNIREYMSSGCSGHTHRLNSKYLTNRKKPYVWYELGCTRIAQQVEYLPTGKVADWQNGFVTVYFYPEGDNVRFYGHETIIIEGRCCFNGIVYDGNYKTDNKP